MVLGVSAQLDTRSHSIHSLEETTMSLLLREYLNFVKEQSPTRPEKQAQVEVSPAEPACNRFPKQGFPRGWKEDSKEEAAKMEMA